MPAFGKRSIDNLVAVDVRLQDLFIKVVQTYDCSILKGRRGEEEQEACFHAGLTTLHYPHSKHNKMPSEALDVAPYPIVWPDPVKQPKLWHLHLARFYHFAGFVKATAQDMGIKIRWGGDWDGDLEFTDQTFHDLPHFELVDR